MCGLAGYLSTDGIEFPAIIAAMANSLKHRGPNEEGFWANTDRSICLGHRRLPIVDLTPIGRQPMVSETGRYVIAFEGEVYNFRELKRSLERAGHKFLGRGDTEVILANLEELGVEKAVPKFIGMFSMAIWDNEKRAISLVRDRLGVKPLYYCFHKGSVLFGSELRALEAFPGVALEVDRDALALMFRHLAIPAPYTIYRGIYKLIPGTTLTIEANKLGAIRQGFSPFPDASDVSPRRYWCAAGAARSGVSSQVRASEDEVLSELEALIRSAVELRMHADVPMGCFLSGGVDSSLVAALMSSISSGPVKTFSIGFDVPDFDEAPFAREVARHLGATHTELYLTVSDIQGVVPRLPILYDEPFSDSSQIPTYLLSKLAKESVTVCLTGDGGDELFGGYRRYLATQERWLTLQDRPKAILPYKPPRRWKALPRSLRARCEHTSNYPMYELSGVLRLDSLADHYRDILSHCRTPHDLVIGSLPLMTGLTDPAYRIEELSPLQTMMLLDLVSYLPDDILTKVDRAGMAVALETRMPFLDHRVVEFAWRLPDGLKVKETISKYPLKRILERFIPKRLFDRPKMGFAIPLGTWLRGPLRDWANHLLDPRTIESQGFLDSSFVQRTWNEHQEGRADRSNVIWSILAFQGWLDAKRRH